MKSRKATTYKPNKNGIIRINYSLFPEVTGEIYVSEENTKLGPIPSFNTLPANYTYRFNDIAILGTCSQACRGCYGMKGQYNMSGPVNVEARNTLLISENMAEVFAQLESWAKENSPEYFRIHSNGDFLNIDEFNNWIELARRCPGTIFYGYTKNYDWLDFAFDGVELPQNFIINISVFDGYGEKVARELFMKYRKNVNIFIAEEHHRDQFDGLNTPVMRCVAYVRSVKKNGKPGAVKLQHDPEDKGKYTCYWCKLCMRPGHVASTLIH